MIIYLKHDEIDRVKWDESVARSLNRKVYAFSWYLDIVSPEWEALVCEDYTSVFPLTPGRKAGLSYLFQPFFAQQLGLFSVLPIDPALEKQFLESVPARFRYIDIHLTPEFVPVSSNVKLIARHDHELSLSGTYDEIRAGYSQNTLRNLRKAAGSGVSAGRNVNAGELVKLFRENFGEKEGKLKDIHYERMEHLMKTALEKGFGSIRAAFDEQGLLSSSAFFLRDGNRIYFLFAASAPSARENGSMFRLIDSFIKENSDSSLILDFEGGNDANLGRFYKSFGAREITYHRLIRNRLPGWMNSGLMLNRLLGEKLK
jgi:hypothetical protein